MDEENDLSPEDLEQELIDSYLAGLSITVDDSDLVGGANDAASAYAKSRSAQLITGVDETTKAKVQSVLSDAFQDPDATIDSIIEDIDGTGAFSPDRSEMIARTEVARAQMQGSVDGWKLLGVPQVQSLPGVGACEDCLVIAAGGPMDIDDASEFPWHPNCNCTLVSVLSEE